MIYNKIEKALNYSKGKNVYEIAEMNGIEIKSIPLESVYGAILIGAQTTIYIDSNLPWQCKEYVLWHEIGHYLMDGTGKYSFSKHGKSELKTNIFACLMLGVTTDSWIKQGCPKNVATDVYDYISQNVLVQQSLSDVYF